MEEREEVKVLGASLPKKFEALALESKREVVLKVISEKIEYLDHTWDYIGNGSVDYLEATFKRLNFMGKKHIFISQLDFPARGRGLVKKFFKLVKFVVYRIFIRPFIWPLLDTQLTFRRLFLKFVYDFMTRYRR